MQELKRENSFTVSEKNETNEGASISVRDPDMMLTMIVLLLTCLAFAVLAHAVI